MREPHGTLGKEIFRESCQTGSILTFFLYSAVTAANPSAVVCDDVGLHVVDIADNGATKRTKFLDAEVKTCVVDNRIGGVWYVAQEKEMSALRFYDFVTRKVTELGDGPGNVSIMFKIAYGDIEHRAGHLQAFLRIVPKVSESGRVRVDVVQKNDPWGTLEEAKKREAALKKSVGSAIEKTIKSRLKRKSNVPIAHPLLYHSETEGPKLPIDTDPCGGDSEICGSTTAIPHTPLWEVTTSFDCGDHCYTDYHLFNAAKLAFVDAHDVRKIAKKPDGLTPYKGVSFHADGRYYVTPRSIVSVTDGPVMSQTTTGGFLYWPFKPAAARAKAADAPK